MAFDGVYYQNLLEQFNNSDEIQKDKMLDEVRKIEETISDKL